MLSRLVKWFVLLLGGFLTVVLALFYLREGSALMNWSKSGTLQTETYFRPDSLREFTLVDSADFVGGPIPAAGDIVVSIGDSAISSARWENAFDRPHPPGRELRISFRHGADTLSTTVRTSAIRIPSLVGLWLAAVLRFLIPISFLSIGLWAFSKRPDAGSVRALTLFCFAMASFMVAAVSLGLNNYAEFNPGFLQPLLSVVGLLSLGTGAFWLHLQLLFPTPRRFMQKHPIAAHALCYVPTVGMALVVLGVIKISWAGPLLGSVIMIQISAGFFILGKAHSTTSDPLAKRQTRLVLWGTGTSMGSLLVLLLVAVLFGNWLQKLPQAIALLIVCLFFITFLASPLSFAYAFGRYRLLEVEGRIRKGTRYVATTILVLVVFYVLIYAVSELLLHIARVESRTPVLIVALILAIGFAPAQRRLQLRLEKWFYPERVRLREMLTDFLSKSLLSADRVRFWTDFEDRLRIALRVDLVFPVLRVAGNGKFAHWKGAATPFLTDSDFIREVSRLQNRPIMRDELVANQRVHLNEAETTWFNQNQVALVLPMATRSRLVGFLALGSKSERRDYEPIDFEILQSLAAQVAVASENILLLEENVEKRRLENELSIARRVQEGMLPQTIPATPGLQLAAHSRFCLEVAGDYYDVVALDDHRTALAIGDVSGKGAGAALLMSNLQASFRTAVGVGMELTPGPTPSQGAAAGTVKLAGMVSRVNELICGNSQAGMFITFFAAVYDHSSGSIDYVNAGHNPPLRLGRDGKIEELTEGGPILGIMPGQTYRQGSLRLQDGDLMMLYTDGVSEAVNAEGEFFGEERIAAVLRVCQTCTSEEALRKLEAEVAQFIGAVPLRDDFTILLARVTRK